MRRAFELTKWFQDSFLAKLKRTLQTDHIANESLLFELGLDSLMAVELRNWFTKEVSVHVPVMRILSNGTIQELVRFVTEKQKIVKVRQDGEAPGSGMMAVSPSTEASAGVSSPSSVDVEAQSIVATAAPGQGGGKSTLQVLSDFSTVFPF